MTSSVLRAERLSLGYGEQTIVHDLDLTIPQGRVTAIVGPNGCGKSTLLRGLSRLLRPKDGRVMLGDRDVHRMPTKQVARSMALLPQHPVVPEGITVGELVARGRHPHHGLLRQWTREDDEVVAESLELTATRHLVSRE